MQHSGCIDDGPEAVARSMCVQKAPCDRRRSLEARGRAPRRRGSLVCALVDRAPGYVDETREAEPTPLERVDDAVDAGNDGPAGRSAHAS